MENDIKENLIVTNKYFKLDFSGQKIEGNKDFEEFKNKQIIELGKDAKLFQCKKDNIYFYISKKDCKLHPYYSKKCPLCKNSICYFCKRGINPSMGDNSNCCIKRKLCYLFFYDIFRHLEEDTKTVRFWVYLILNLIPFFGCLLFFLIFVFFIFLFIVKRKKVAS